MNAAAENSGKNRVHIPYSSCTAAVHRRSAALLAVLVFVLAACAAKPPPDHRGGFRDPSALIGATSRYDAARFAGDWQVRAAYPGDERLRRVALVNRDGPAFELVVRSCAENGDCEDVGNLWRATQQGPGRYTLKDPQIGPDRQLWVLWVDEGFRTAVIGTPTGRYGWILDRKLSGGSDRIAAAREILEFNGYDLGPLQVRP